MREHRYSVLKSIPFVLMAVILVALLPGCVHMEGTVAGTPTPMASPTPLPAPFQVEYTAAPVETDLMGRRIEGEDHYFTYYLAFGDLRVYEYENSTLIDGVVMNGFMYPLQGEVCIRYYNEAGRLIGTGVLQTADGTGLFRPGSNRLYGEILTDVPVQDKDFVLEMTVPFRPVIPD